jgi:hypothetical protein
MKIHGRPILVQLAQGEFLSHFNLRLKRSRSLVRDDGQVSRKLVQKY